MDIKYRLYPHPVLWDKSDDYQKSSFNCSITIERDVKQFILNVEFGLDNEILENLIINKQAEYVLHIESPATSYRILKNTGQNNMKVVLKDEHLMGRVSLCPFIIAKEDFEHYTNNDFNKDYDGAAFNIQKGTVLAIGSQFDFKVDKEKEDLSQIPSIFTIYKKETTDEMGMEVELYSHKIRIGLNITDYERYNVIARNMPDVVNSFIILPALIYAFEQIRCDFDDFQEYRWFQSVEKIFKKYSITFNDELLNSKTSLELDQKVMGLTITKDLM